MPMDWKKLLQELKAAGWSQAMIAERCKVGQATVSELARGVTVEPGFTFGDALRNLHIEVCAEKREQAA
jgi:transcriptional regulator with XRE-family HTH domain